MNMNMILGLSPSPSPSPSPSLSSSSSSSLRPATAKYRHYQCCRASWQELAGVLVFSAIPFTAVKAIANSPLGETLQRRMEDKKKFAVENASRYKTLAQKAKKDSFWYGEERPRWLGPIPFQYPSYLDGELPGDYGFDIAGLSQDPASFKRYYKVRRWIILESQDSILLEVKE